MKTLFASAIILATSAIASAQNLPPNQESGDIYNNIVPQFNADGSVTVSSPFNMGFVYLQTGPLFGAVFNTLNDGTATSPAYIPYYVFGSAYLAGTPYQSSIGLDFFTGGDLHVTTDYYVQANSLCMYASDLIPCVETTLPKGTYTFQATATPLGGPSTAGTFMFETCTAGVWTVQFNLALPKPEGATRTLTFAHDSKVRWLLINNPGQTANAAITAKYYNSGG